MIKELKEKVNSNNFSSNVERLAKEKNCKIIEAVIIYCTDNSIEIESVPELCNKRLKDKIKTEAVDLNMLKEKGPKSII